MVTRKGLKMLNVTLKSGLVCELRKEEDRDDDCVKTEWYARIIGQADWVHINQHASPYLNEYRHYDMIEFLCEKAFNPSLPL